MIQCPDCEGKGVDEISPGEFGPCDTCCGDAQPIDSYQIPGRRTIRNKDTIRLSGGDGGGPRHRGVFQGERGLCRVSGLARDNDGRVWADVCFIDISAPAAGKSSGQAIGKIVTVLLDGPDYSHPTIPGYVISPYKWMGTNKSFEAGTA